MASNEDDRSPVGPPTASAATPQRHPARLEAAKTLTRGRRLWAVAAAVVIAVGTVSSMRTATAVAHKEHQKAQGAFAASSAEIATTLQLAIQREHELTVSMQAFLAINPHATNATFLAWAGAMRAMQRHPELLGWGETVIVPASQLAAFAASG